MTRRLALHHGVLHAVEVVGLALRDHRQRQHLCLQHHHAHRVVHIQHPQHRQLHLHLFSLPGAQRPHKAAGLGQIKGGQMIRTGISDTFKHPQALNIHIHVVQNKHPE